MAKGLLAVLLGSSLAIVSAAAHAQTTSGASNVAPVTVTGYRAAPPEIASRSQACELAMSDTHTRALLGYGVVPFIYAPTRTPRNPDYSAPPKVAPGSPYPPVMSLREYGMLRGAAQSTDADVRADVGAPLPGAEIPETSLLASADAAPNDLTLEAAIDACRSGDFAGGGYSGGGVDPSFSGFYANVTGGSSFDAGANMRAMALDARGRNRIKRWDKTLPMGFALFDQGRYEEALEEFRKAERKLTYGQGGDEAALMIGKIYLQGLGERSDPVEAVKWLEKAAGARFDSWRQMPVFDPRQPERNTAIGEANVILANLYRTGQGPIPRDIDAARRYLKRAYDVGHIPAAKALGDIDYYGLDAPRDIEAAVREYERAAKFGYAPAQVALAQMYAAGEVGGAPNMQKALAWNQEAAKLNHPDALYALAVAYDRGEGVPSDPDLALGFYKTAAAQGNPAAQAALGTYFYQGESVPRDLALARGWFEAAAIGGDPDGMFNLAAMMARGEGGGVDRVKAWAWLKIADRQGHPNALAAARAIEADFTPQDRAGVAELVTNRAG